MYIPTGSATAAAGNYMDLMLNNISGSFATSVSYPANLAPGASYAFHATFVQGNTLAQSAMGYTTLATLYSTYKVNRFRLSVTCQPANGNDASQLVVLPIGGEEIPSSSGFQVDTRVMASQPNAVAKVTASGVPPRENTVTIAHDVYHILGITKQQYEDYPPVTLSSAPTAYPCYGGIFIQQLNGANNTSPIVVQIVLEQDVTFSDVIQPIN